MEKIYMLNNSQGVIRTLVGLKSRIDSIFHRVSSDSILSRICLVSLILLLVGGFSTKVWGGKVKGIASVIEGKGSVKVRVERQRIYGWETAKEGSVVNQDSSDPSTAEHSSGYAKQCVFSVVSEATGYKFAGWYAEENNGSLTYKDNIWNVRGPYVTSAVDRTYTYRAKFSPITYTISFNSNPGTGTVVGSTADVTGVKYDQDATLTPNGYQKIAYVVTYDANGGSGLSKTTDKTYYDFEGWTKDTKTYTDGATVRNLSSTDGGTATLYAKWGSGTSSITLPPAPSVAKPYDGEGEGEYTFAGWYLSTDGTQTVIGVNGDSYKPTANVTLKAKWTSVKVPTFSAPNFVEGAKTLKVGETYSSFIFSNTSTSTPSSLTSAKFYYEIFDEEVQTDNTDGCLEANKNKVISFDGTTITALNKGTAKIAFYQKEDTENNIEQRTSDTYTINVDKNVPSITFASAPYYYNATINNFYSSDNSATSISAESDNTGVASISGTTLTTYNKAGTAQITVSQAENYYWAYHEESVDVTPQSKANHVTYTITNSNYEGIEVSKTSNVAWITDGSYKLGTGDWGTSKPDDNVIISLEGIPDKLSFTLSCDPVQVAGTHYPSKKDYTFEVYESATNGNWGNKIWGNDNSSGYSAPEDVQVQLSTSTRYIKLRYTGTCWGRFNNIQVTELQYFRRQGENATLNFATNLKNHVPAVQSFVVEHANAGYQTSVTAPAHYLVSTDNVNFASEVVYSTNASAKTAGDKMGTFTVYVKYLADAEGTHNANVTVHNNLRSDFNVPVTGTTQGKLSTTLHYIGASAYNADTTNLVATDLFEVRDANSVKVEGAVITLTTGTASSVILANDAKSIAELCGNSNEGTTGNVVASYAGDNTTYAAATNNGLSQNFTINRLNDEVSFDSGYESMVVGEEIDLTEWATSCTSGSDITVTSVFKDYIVIEDGKVKAVAKGNGRLRAESAGNCTYNSGRKFLNITVRNPQDPCESAILYKSALIKVGAYTHNSFNPETYTIPDGPQDKLTFKVWKVFAATQKATLQILDEDYNVLPNGTIDYGVSSLPYEEPESPNAEINMANYPGAKKLRFYGSGSLNKYFSEVRISQKAYLTASTLSVTMSTVQACDTAKGQFTVDYSDVSHIQLSQTNNDFSYEVWDGETKLIGFENGCKSYGTYTVKFFYVPQAKGPYSNTVTISASGKSQTITLNGTANKPDRTIVWDIPSGNEISATQSVDLTAYAETSCLSPAGGVYYTAVPSDAVRIDGDLITFNRAATVTVTAHTVPSDDYNDALTVDKVWTVGKVGVVMQTLPTITSTITCGNTSSVVTWANDWTAVSSLNDKDTIPGSIAYVGPAIFTTAGETNLTFNFTPNDLTVYDAMSFNVPVTVQHITSVATPSAANIVYGNPISSSTLSNTGTPGTWSWNTADNSAVLAVGTHTGLAVHFTPYDSNYSELDATVTLIVDPVPADEFTNAEGDNDWDNPNNWASGEVPTDETPDIIVSGELVIDEEVTVGSITIQSTGGVTVVTDGILTVTGVSEDIASYGDLHVKNDGEVILANTADLKVNNFILDAKLGDADKQAASGQIFGIDHMTIDNKVYFDITFDPRGYITFGWYDFAVPFEVNINGGISRINSTSDKVMVSGKDFILKEADEAARANGGYIWRKVTSSVLTPGKLYTITLDDEVNQNTLRFTWNGHNGLSNGTSFDPQFTASGSDTEMRGWNGVGNGMLSHGYPAVSYKRQAYNHDDNKYELVTGDKTFAVGSAFVIQVPDENSFDWTPAQSSLTRPLFAPQYETYEVDEFLLNLRQTETNKVADKLYFSASDDATDAYVIGRDLLKMGNPLEAKSAQMWATKGGRVLCDVEATLYNDNASTPITFFAPQAGTYTLSVEEMPENASLYLTYEGKAIWLLSAGAYTLDLEKGTTEGFGLRLVTNASQVTTGVDAIESEDGTNRKVIINNTMYIITKDGAIYDVLGKSVKN